ncbi:hypothetical protein ABZ456_29090 [Streptomyces sp. NPDC005776]|uniref:hypothetical protein n=1 Tax=Streptomyces sp. NPDC005776 TaxID=3154676 RepID=UPI0033C2F6A6
MAILTNRNLTQAPAPGTRRYGLFTAATVLDDLAGRDIAAGFQFPVLDCGAGVAVYDANCDTHPEKVFAEGLGYAGGDPYWVYAGERCATLGRTAAEIGESVRRSMAAGEQTLVESVLWDGGGLGSDPSLTAAGATIVTPLAPGAGAAVSALEAAFYAVNGYVGTIHINTAAEGALSYAQMLSRSGGAGVLTTPIGSRVSLGAGYGITGPADVAPDAGFVWAFMTSPVTVRRSPVVVPDVWQTADRGVNQFQALAERVYAHAWACPQVFAVQVPVAAPATAAAPAVPVEA